MSNIVNLSDARTRRAGPDSNFVQVVDGTTFYMYSASYKDGANFDTIMFWASSSAEARHRVRLMRSSLTLDGQIYASIEE